MPTIKFHSADDPAPDVDPDDELVDVIDIDDDEVDAIAGHDTGGDRRYIVDVRLPLLAAGDRGAAVDLLQRVLAVDTTGVVDDTTVAAIRNIQHRHRLLTTGHVDTDTWRAVLTP